MNVTVIKLGGSLLEDATRRDAALRDIVARWNAGESLVLVHGGGKHIDAALAKLGIAKRTHAGLRVTDDVTLDVVVSVLGGTVNKGLVAELTKLGVRAAGISGCDGGTLIAEQHPPIDGVDLGHVGRVTGSSSTLLRSMLNYGILPVVSSIAMSTEGALLNVNADSAAAALAVGLRAKALRFITDVAGLLDANGQVVPKLHAGDAEAYIARVSGGMKPKLQAALSALKAGVGAIEIGENGGTNLVAA
ncbi:MAG TPA: acetylglutamate kinase [Thermoanaerobaculia bacterium]|nr:acetylglutamate kinase [Thermoanaerobaculia bacterium]